MSHRLKWIGLFFLVSAICLAPIETNAQSGLSAIRVYPPMGATPSPTPIPLTQPLFALSPPGDYNRLFIVCQTGQVYILKLATGVLNPTPFLDISSRLTSTFGEQGLLGMAFDPNYASNGKFYLNFTVPGGAFIPQNGTTRVSQFSVSAGDPDLADISLGNEKLLVTFDHPQSNHNGGWIGFSPRAGDDHNLYISTGDGGNGNDQDPSPAPTPPGHIEPGGNAQNITTLLGKMLRIHVDATTGIASIPPDNPYANASPSPSPATRREIFCLGLRNPFRNSFDRATGRMFIADVGQAAREEIDVQQATNPGGGENYGWRLREGTIPTPTGNPVVGGPPPPGNVEPIIDYPRTTGGTVIGGYVYRGRQIPQLRGVYVFGDSLVSKIFTLNYDGTFASNFQDVTSSLFPISNPPNGNINLGNPSGFGEDANGEIYICDITTGNIFKIVPTTPSVTITSISRGLGGAVISGQGAPFMVHTVQATSSLTNQFVDLGPVTANGDGTFQFPDGDAGSFPNRFYRVTYP